MSSLGLPLLGLLKATGLDLATITPLDQTGVKLLGNQLSMDPACLFPAPKLQIDHIKSATLSKARPTVVFASRQGDPKFSKIPVASDSHIWSQSGDARFFSTVRVNTRLLMKNIHAKRRHFSLYRDRAQTDEGVSTSSWTATSWSTSRNTSTPTATANYRSPKTRSPTRIRARQYNENRAVQAARRRAIAWPWLDPVTEPVTLPPRTLRSRGSHLPAP